MASSYNYSQEDEALILSLLEKYENQRGRLRLAWVEFRRQTKAEMSLGSFRVKANRLLQGKAEKTSDPNTSEAPKSEFKQMVETVVKALDPETLKGTVPHATSTASWDALVGPGIYLKDHYYLREVVQAANECDSTKDANREGPKKTDLCLQAVRQFLIENEPEKC